ncbi:ferrochelatase, partial [Reticulomyxa filosa]
MLNMGGPAQSKDTKDFLTRLFNDPELIPLGGGGLQRRVMDIVVKRRLPRVEKQYETIGGSPIRKWTDIQGHLMCEKLDALSPETAPHKHYACFRYAPPFTEDVLQQMKEDGIEHAVAFSQYPQWCCSTSGSSINHLWRQVHHLNLEHAFHWSIIDRWFLHRKYVQSVAERILSSVTHFVNTTSPVQSNSQDIAILFSAHSVPLKT